MTSKTNEYDLTLTFRIKAYDGRTVDPGLATALNRIFQDWNDGRYPFAVEMVERGLMDCVRDGVYQCCQKRADVKFGNEMVQTSPNGTTSRAYMEANDEYERIHREIPFWHNKPTVKIERVQSE
jgi:hypothetical protein